MTTLPMPMRSGTLQSFPELGEGSSEDEAPLPLPPPSPQPKKSRRGRFKSHQFGSAPAGITIFNVDEADAVSDLSPRKAGRPVPEEIEVDDEGSRRRRSLGAKRTTLSAAELDEQFEQLLDQCVDDRCPELEDDLARLSASKPAKPERTHFWDRFAIEEGDTGSPMSPGAPEGRGSRRPSKGSKGESGEVVNPDQAREAKFTGNLARVRLKLQAARALGDRFVNGEPVIIVRKDEPEPKHKYVNINDLDAQQGRVPTPPKESKDSRKVFNRGRSAV